MRKVDDVIKVNINKRMEIKWWWMCSLSELYQFTLEPEFVEHKDRQEILEFLQKSEGIRPEDINRRLPWTTS